MKANTFFALVTGMAAGAILGLIFAPEKGETTREQIRKGAEDGMDKLRGALKRMQEGVEEVVEEVEDKLQNLAAEAEAAEADE